ncbi:MAG: hypothetical protein JKX75_08095 [Gammaproteobacteria bacterium]|nr:hypothetical protein [Gammaproteobacteria bacterium]
MLWVSRIRVFVIISFAVVLISAAVIFSVLRAVLPYATDYKNEIQLELSQQIGLPVEIKSIDAAIHWFSPRLKLIGVTVYDEKYKSSLFNFREAFVQLNVAASLLRREIIIENIGIIGADISIEKLSESDWLIQGIKFSSGGTTELPEQFMYMLQNADYLLHDSNIYYQDQTGEKLYLNLLDVNINVENSFNNHSIKFSMNLPEEYGRNLMMVANLSGDFDNLHGNVFFSAEQVKLKQWNKKFHLTDKFSFDATIDARLWLTLVNNNIQEMFMQFAAEDVSIKNTATRKKWKTNYLSSNVRYVFDNEHWNLAISDFYFGGRNNPSWGEPFNIITSDDNTNYYLSAEFLRLGDVQDMAEVFLDSKQLLELKKLDTYQLQADIYNLNLKLPKDISKDISPENLLEHMYLDFSVVDFSVHDKTSGIALTGLDASFHVDNNQAIIDVVSKNVNINFTELFRDPLFADIIQGQLTIDNDGEDWLINSEQLQIKNSHVNLFSRLAVKTSSSENVFVDMQTDIYDAYAKHASQYLPVGIMSTELIDWLDMAIVDGYIPQGQFILHGNLNDFPYEKHRGIFQVLVDAQDVTLQFLEDWPRLTNASAAVKFENQSLFVRDAKAATKSIALFNGYAEIINLNEPHLKVITKGRGKNQDVQSYVWASALDDILGDAMRLFQLEGKSGLKLKLDVPLSAKEINVAIDGHLHFQNTSLYYPALGYELTGINGQIDFTEDSVFAKSIKAKIQGEPVAIKAFTRKSTRNKNTGDEVVFNLEGVLDADYLLQQHDWIPEQWVSGKSNWSVDIEIPYEEADYLVHVKASSHLQGVSFDLSDAAHKIADSNVRFTTDIDVLENNALQVVMTTAKLSPEVSLSIDKDKILVDNNTHIYAVRDENKNWTFDIDSQYIKGKGEFSEDFEKDTAIRLNLDKIDVYSLFYRSNKEPSNKLKPADIPPLNWQVKTVLYDKWTFTDVTVKTDWHKYGMLINTLSLHGPAMTFDAHGTWLTSWRGEHETVLQGTLHGDNLGQTLTSLGFQKSIDRAKYESTFDAKWSAEPYGVSWENLNGKANFKMKKGEIVDVDPGAGGRLLGLLNIFKITNRLLFDFDDVTRDGFAFDFMEGEFEFVNGDGSLKDFNISAPAADINIFGSIGMVKQDYGLLMRVKPHTDTITFVGGVLLGGPVVGAGLALIQKVFDLGVIGHNVYSITGSWDDPKIDQIVERRSDADLSGDDEDDF